MARTSGPPPETHLDGIYVCRQQPPSPDLDDSATVRAYKSLAQVERAIGSMKAVDLQIRPIFHWTAPRVRAHVCLCNIVRRAAAQFELFDARTKV